MRRPWAIAALVALFLTVSAQGQRRGGMSAGHPGGGFRGPVMVNRGPVFSGMRSGVGVGTTFRQPFISSRCFPHRRFFSGFSPWLYYPAYYGYPSIYGDYSYAMGSDRYSAYDSAYIQNSEIEQQEINRLRDEVDRLREERDAQPSAPTPPSKPETAAPPSEPTVLVFRDQHKEEVKNYAIVGRTLWVFSEVRARKISINDLDVDATTKVNEDRGLEFRVPE